RDLRGGRKHGIDEFAAGEFVTDGGEIGAGFVAFGIGGVAIGAGETLSIFKERLAGGTITRVRHGEGAVAFAASAGGGFGGVAGRNDGEAEIDSLAPGGLVAVDGYKDFCARFEEVLGVGKDFDGFVCGDEAMFSGGEDGVEIDLDIFVVKENELRAFEFIGRDIGGDGDFAAEVDVGGVPSGGG